MDRRMRERRSSVKRQRGRRRGTLLIVGLAMLAVAGLFVWLRSSEVFAVKRITYTTVQHLTNEDISRATAGVRGTNLLRLSTGEIEERLAEFPYVRSVEIHRRFPETLDISLVEYEPVARIQGKDGGVWLVAIDGRVLEKRSVAGLPLVVPVGRVNPVPGETLPGAIVRALPVAELLANKEIAASLPAFDQIRVSADGEVMVEFDSGTELRLGRPTELKQKLTVAATIIERCLRDGKQLDYLDASTPDRVAVNQK